MLFELPLMEDVDLSVAVITCAPGVVKIAAKTLGRSLNSNPAESDREDRWK